MDATVQTPADNAVWSNTLDKLLTAGTSIYTGITNAQVAKATAKANAKAAPAVASQQNSNVLKYVLIAVAAIAAIVLVIFVIKKKY
jgi:aryl-alcohol dehydrogenase-like predicted oxidoreductase